MNILIIEDDPDFVGEIKTRVDQLCREPMYTIAACVQSATEKLEREFFDLIFLDLKIPSTTNSMDSDPQHGRNILDIAKTVAPGTPIFILTGSSAEQFLPEMMKLSHQVDIWGQNKELPLIGFQKKHRIDELNDAIKPYIEACDSVCEVEVNESDDISFSVIRIIKIFTALVGGVFCNIRRIGGGLSDASVYKLEVKDGNGSTIHNSVAKIGEPHTIQDEVERHDRFIQRLGSNATPRKVAVLNYGAKKTSGVFYSLAIASELNGFSFIDEGAGKLIEGIIGCLQAWNRASTQRRVTIKEIRRTFIDDECFNRIRPLISHEWVDNFEMNSVQINWGCVHGDLHGLNVLSSSDSVPVLIDYGDVCECASSRDPITFELSVFFHPEGPLRNSAWPNNELATLWGQVEFINDDCPATEYFKSCREWSVKVSVGRRERAAVAYGYLVRQFKYEGCNIQRANAFLEGVKQLYDIA